MTTFSVYSPWKDNLLDDRTETIRLYSPGRHLSLDTDRGSIWCQDSKQHQDTWAHQLAPTAALPECSPSQTARSTKPRHWWREQNPVGENRERINKGVPTLRMRLLWLQFRWLINDQQILTWSIAFLRKVRAFGMSLSTPCPYKVNQCLPKNVHMYTTKSQILLVILLIFLLDVTDLQ